MKQSKFFWGLLCSMMLLACNSPKTLQDLPSQFVENDAVRIHYKVYGSGNQTLVFVHGFGCDMNSWQEQFAYFADKARMLFIDLPGYGQSDRPQVEYTLDLFADAVKTVMETERLDKAVLVGHSLGTPVCRQVVYQYPELAAKLVDVDGVYCFYPADPMMEVAYHAFAESFHTDSIRPLITAFVESLYMPQTPPAVKEYALSVMPETPMPIAYSTMSHLIEEPYWTQGVIAIPTMVIASKNSEIPPEYEQIMGTLYRDMEYHELDSIGHFIMMEQPLMFNKMLAAFIE